MKRRPLALVVDVDWGVCASLERALDGCLVEPTRSVTTALEVIRRSAVVDLALVEFEISDGCGFAVLRELSEHQPRAVRVLMARTHAIRRFADATLAHLLLTKPFDPQIANDRSGRNSRWSRVAILNS